MIWVYEKGYKLLPQDLRGRAAKRATALLARKGWLSTVVKKGTGPFLAIGFAALTAERMYAHGATDQEVAKAIVNDFYYGIPGLINAGADAALAKATAFAQGIRTGVFSYLDDEAYSKFDGSNGLLDSELSVDAIIRAQDGGGATMHASSLLW